MSDFIVLTGEAGERRVVRKSAIACVEPIHKNTWETDEDWHGCPGNVNNPLRTYVSISSGDRHLSWPVRESVEDLMVMLGVAVDEPDDRKPLPPMRLEPVKSFLDRQHPRPTSLDKAVGMLATAGYGVVSGARVRLPKDIADEARAWCTANGVPNKLEAS